MVVRGECVTAPTPFVLHNWLMFKYVFNEDIAEEQICSNII